MDDFYVKGPECLYVTKLRNKILKFPLEDVILFCAIRVIYGKVIGVLIYLTNQVTRFKFSLSMG